MSNNALLMRFTKEEYSHLIQLSNESQVSPANYIRLLIEYAYQGNKLSKQLDKVHKGEVNEIELNGYGYGIHKEEFDAFLDTMEKAIKGLNLTDKGLKKSIRLKRKTRLKAA